MNEAIKNLSIEVNNLLLEEESIKRYINLKKNIYNDETLLKEFNKMNFYKNCNVDSLDNFEAQKIYKKINENPVIHNFINLNEEVNLLLLEVKKYLL
ncbi:MAG: YlbF family regulator [Candidatus Onthovivens sp.]|nr:YlbF family regulator [Candidatus Onthovivens sp.]MDY4937325.1 YlbF family regulator [Candidatus Onthovivens sp.]